jgi:hypothetical protein
VQLVQLVGVLGREIVRLRPVGRGVVELPDVVVEGGHLDVGAGLPRRAVLDDMRVQVDDARVVGPSNDFGEQFITTKPTQATTYRGGTEILAENAIPSGRVEVVPVSGADPAVSVGDVFTGATVGRSTTRSSGAT